MMIHSSPPPKCPRCHQDECRIETCFHCLYKYPEPGINRGAAVVFVLALTVFTVGARLGYLSTEGLYERTMTDMIAGSFFGGVLMDIFVAALGGVLYGLYWSACQFLGRKA